MEDLKTLHDQALGAAGQARKAVENNAMILQQKLAERTKLLSQLEQAKMQETVAQLAGVDVVARRARQHPVAGRGARQDRAAVRQRDGPGRARLQLGRGPHARGAEVDASTWPARPGSSRSGPAWPASSWPAVSRAPGGGAPRPPTPATPADRPGRTSPGSTSCAPA